MGTLRITCEETLDEMIDAHLFKFLRSKATRRSKARGLLFVPVVGVLFYLFGIQSDPTVRLLFALFATIVYAVAYSLLYPRLIRRSIRAQLIENLGSIGPYPCVYELSEAAIHFRYLGLEIKCEWQAVTSVRETERYLEIDAGHTGYNIFIPLRIFQDPDQKETWLRVLRERSGRTTSTLS